MADPTFAPQLGEVSCEKRLCPRSCAEPPALPAACCPPCPGNGDTRDTCRHPCPGGHGHTVAPTEGGGVLGVGVNQKLLSLAADVQRSNVSLSPSHGDSHGDTPHPSPPTSTRPPPHRLAQLLLPNTTPHAPSMRSEGAGEPPPTTLSPPRDPLTTLSPPDTPSEATAPPGPRSSSPKDQRPPGDTEPSAVSPAP